MIRLLAISDGRAATSGPEPVLEWLRDVGRAGVDAVQLREKALSDRELFALAHRARTLLPPATRLVINGRADIALAAGAEGVHLPSRGVPASALRDRFGPRLLVGVSTHSVGEVEAVRDAGADYVVFGPVYPTPSKPGLETIPGLEGLEQAARIGIPVLALGGVDLDRLTEVADTGAAGCAGIRCFRDREGLSELVSRARELFDSKEPSP